MSGNVLGCHRVGWGYVLLSSHGPRPRRLLHAAGHSTAPTAKHYSVSGAEGGRPGLVTLSTIYFKAPIYEGGMVCVDRNLCSKDD